MERLSVKKLSRADACLKTGDLWILPPFLNREQEYWAAQSLPDEALSGCQVNRAYALRNLPNLLLNWALMTYERARLYGLTPAPEPAWVNRCNRLAKRYLRLGWTVGEGTDPRHIVHGVPNAGFGYVVEQEGLASDAFATFKLDRLFGVRQLGFLHDPVARSGHSSAGLLFEHSRGCHLLDTYAFGTLMLSNFGDSVSEPVRRTVQLACLTHDWLTPAGGDTVKLVDPEGFDEDTTYPTALKGLDLKYLRKSYGIDPELLTETVRGNGWAGQMLDLADKLAYVARDAFWYVCRYGPDGPVTYPDGFPEVRALTLGQTHACGLWDAVGLKDGRLFVADPERLYRFLKLRALLFRQLYQHPGARFLEFITATTAIRALYDRGKLCRQQLLSMTDFELERTIDHEVGPYFCTHLISFNAGEVCVETFKTETEATARQRELVSAGVRLAQVENLNRRINPATHYLVPHRGTLAPFCEVRPKEAAEIEGILEKARFIRLYWVPEPIPDGSRLRHLAEKFGHRT